MRLGANESSFGVSPLALQAMKEAIQHVPWYGDAENYDLRQALARQLAVGMDNIVIGSGIDELLGLTVRLFLNPGDTSESRLQAHTRPSTTTSKVTAVTSTMSLTVTRRTTCRG